MSITKFLFFNNAVPVGIMILALGAGGAFAATNPDAILATHERVVSIDNTYIVNKDLSTYSPSVTITGVTEDTDTYYVSYRLSTIDIKDSVWGDTVNDGLLKVDKAEVTHSGDLGHIATLQLKQLVEHESARLAEVQQIEKKNVSTKTVAVSYSGLVGKLLDEKTEVIPAYQPPAPPQVAVNPVQQNSQPAAVVTTQSTNVSSNSGDTTPPNIQILGSNPAQIEKGQEYVDLGVVVTDNVDHNLGVSITVNGVNATSASVDTSKEGTTTIQYSAKDQAGNSATATRIVVVGAGSVIAPVQVVPNAVVASSTDASTTGTGSGTSVGTSSPADAPTASVTTTAPTPVAPTSEAASPAATSSATDSQTTNTESSATSTQ